MKMVSLSEPIDVIKLKMSQAYITDTICDSDNRYWVGTVDGDVKLISHVFDDKEEY